MLDTAQLRALYPKAPDDHITAFAQNCGALFDTYQITPGNRLQFFLAQIGHESGGLTITEENLNYSAPRMCQIWPSRFPTLQDALPCERNPQRLANTVYSNRLGNGGPDSNDGWNFRGRGYIQITGRTNYQSVGNACGLDLVGTPSLAAAPQSALDVALGFWTLRGLNALCDSGDFVAVTRRINGGTVGLDDRQAWLDKVRRALATPPNPGLKLSEPQVVALQKALRNAGYAEVGAADGDIGQRTTGAIQRFRHDKGLPDSPLIDDSLIDALGLVLV